MALVSREADAKVARGVIMDTGFKHPHVRLHGYDLGAHFLIDMHYAVRVSRLAGIQ